jgi:hypothetical protein
LQKKLGVGRLSVKEKYVDYIVSTKEDLLQIFSIFDKRYLNTSKILNYILFRKAYDLYFNRESIKVSLELRETLMKLKGQMNKNRKDFNPPKDHYINITPY